MTDVTQPRRRGTLAALEAQRPPQRPMLNDDGSVGDQWRFNRAAQAFFREMGPIFAAMAGSADSPLKFAESGAVASTIEVANQLATAMAKRFTGKASVSGQEIQPFRRPAAEVVLNGWGENGLDDFDAAAVVDQCATAFRLVDEGLDQDFLRDMNTSEEASIKLTSVAVTMTLSRPVMVYDFRRDRTELVSDMTGAVLTAAMEGTRKLVGKDAKRDDRRMTFQSLANRNAELMASIYERKVKQVLSHIGGLDEAKKAEFARRYDPMPEILRSFRDWSGFLSEMSVAAGRSAMLAVSASDDKDSAERSV